MEPYCKVLLTDFCYFTQSRQRPLLININTYVQLHLKKNPQCAYEQAFSVCFVRSLCCLYIRFFDISDKVET